MALLCNDCEIRGGRKEIWCKHTETPCVFIRFCRTKGRYYQTDGAAHCKMKGKGNGKDKTRNEADASDRAGL